MVNGKILDLTVDQFIDLLEEEIPYTTSNYSNSLHNRIIFDDPNTLFMDRYTPLTIEQLDANDDYPCNESEDDNDDYV